MANTQHSASHEYKQAEEFINPETGEFDPSLMIDEAIYIKTITPAKVNALPERAKIAGHTMLLYTVSGIVSGTVIQTDAAETQEFEAFVGEFEAIVYIDDGDRNGRTQKYRSGFCYLPSGYHEKMLTAYKRSLRRAQIEDPMNTVQQAFIFDIAATPAANPRGYSYMATNAMGIDRHNDALSVLNAQHSRALANPRYPQLGNVKTQT